MTYKRDRMAYIYGYYPILAGLIVLAAITVANSTSGQEQLVANEGEDAFFSYSNCLNGFSGLYFHYYYLAIIFFILFDYQFM